MIKGRPVESDSELVLFYVLCFRFYLGLFISVDPTKTSIT